MSYKVRFLPQEVLKDGVWIANDPDFIR